MKILNIFFLLIITNLAFNNILSQQMEMKSALFSDSQLNRFYSVNLPKYSSPEELSKYTLYFLLCENGNYEISLSDNNYTTVIIDFPISKGKYEIKNDTLILTDSFTHYQLLYHLDSTYIKPIKTYPFMNEIVFKDYYTVCDMKNSNIDEEITIENIVSDFEKTNTHNNHLKEGIYKYEIFYGTRFELKLKSDKKYEFNFKEEEMQPLSSKLELYLIFSVGTWERKGNILTLWDTNFQHTFYGLIRDDGIELLIFRWQDVVFERKDW